METLSYKVGFRSVRLMQRLLNEILDILPVDFKRLLETTHGEVVCSFPDLEIAPAVGDFEGKEEFLLNFKTPELDTFKKNWKKGSLCYMC